MSELISDSIQGDYCIANYIIRDLGLRDHVKIYIEVSWQQIGDNLTEASDIKRIARFFSDLPNGDFTNEFKSLFQLEEWIGWKDRAIRIGKCFLAGDEHSDDPLAQDLEHGLIDKWLHKYIWLETKLFQNWWNLVHFKESSIKAALSQIWGYPFNSSLDLFMEMVKEDIDGEFANCLRQVYCYKPKEIKKIAILKRKDHRGKLSKSEREQLYVLIDKNSHYPIWYHRVLSVSEFLAKEDSFIQTCLRRNTEILDAISKMQIQRDCNPNFKHHNHISYTWEKGIRCKGIKPGWKNV